MYWRQSSRSTTGTLMLVNAWEAAGHCPSALSLNRMPDGIHAGGTLLLTFPVAANLPYLSVCKNRCPVHLCGVLPTGPPAACGGSDNYVSFILSSIVQARGPSDGTW